MLLAFPLVVIRVDPLDDVLEMRWDNLVWIGGLAFLGTLLWDYFQQRKTSRSEAGFLQRKLLELQNNPAQTRNLFVLLGVALCVFPFVMSPYQTSILTTALMYVMLGLGLNIVVGLAGLLDLGYVAFYAVGAYSYALLNLHFGLGFWAVLPIAGVLAGLFGIMLGIPVLRLRGDYLAIVTLGFGEIIRLVMENWSSVTEGPRGIPNLPKPQLPVELEFGAMQNFLYFLMLAFTVVTVFVVRRLDHSRLGRSWVALREDELACQAMGIDTTRTKLKAFALGACWAGFVGVFFAAKNSFVNPASFTFLQSAIILCVVVMGGMGSVQGVILAALVIVLVPEYLRAFSDYRMLAFGGIMVVMMVFRPQGLIPPVRRRYTVPDE
jgi:branched-chain amino acid transport system permease protein